MLGGMSGPLTMTSLEASDAMSIHNEAVNFAISVLPRGKHVCNATTRGVIARAYYSVDKDRLAEFGKMLGTGVVPNPNATAVILLRQYLYNNAGSAITCCESVTPRRNERWRPFSRASRSPG